MKKNKTTEKVYDFIIEFARRHGYSPSFRDIADAMNIKSPSTIFYHINKLIADGRIQKDSYKNRSLSIKDVKSEKHRAEEYTEFSDIPIIGSVAAGIPILAVENIIDNIRMPASFFAGNELFSLKVKGDSMQNAGMLDGDIIIVNKQSDAENGEIIVAMLDDEVTVKRLFKEKSRIKLQPENDNYAPIYGTEICILGKVVGLIRQL